MTQMSELLRVLRLPSIPTLALYAATLVAEVPVIFARMLITFALLAIFTPIEGKSPASAESLVELALIPTAWSILALITPFGGGWWWLNNMGGRQPSERERAAYHDATQLLQAHAIRPLRLPSMWFVLDVFHPDAAVCGNALMLSRGLVESEHLPAVLAHELGHLATPDGKLTAALNRLVSSGLRVKERDRHALSYEHGIELLLEAMAWAVGKLLVLIRGGLGLRLTRPLWGNYWRAREYLADAYAASLGQADELADFLEVHALINDHPVPFIWLTEHTHPPTELRIDKLRAAAVAPGSEPVKAAPSEPPSAGPDGPALTEPDPSAEGSLRWAGRALPRLQEPTTDDGDSMRTLTTLRSHEGLREPADTRRRETGGTCPASRGRAGPRGDREDRSAGRAAAAR